MLLSRYNKMLFACGLLLAVAGNPLFAQNGKNTRKGLRPVPEKKAEGLFLLADGKKDSVVLRWVPSSDILWKMGNKYGYTIERFTVLRKGKVVPNGNKLSKQLTPEPLKPWSHAALEKLVQKNDYAGVLDEALYGNDFNIQMKSESPSEIINQVQQAQNRFSFALLVCDFSPAVARAAGLRFVDKKPVAGERYIYRVKIAMPDSLRTTVRYKPGVTMLGPEEAFLKPAIQGLKGQFGNKAVALSWDLEMLHGIYTAFNIQRSENGGPFVQVNVHPFLPMSTTKDADKFAYYVDSLKANYTPYEYRITGISPFGETGNYSDTVRGEGLSVMDYRPFFDTIYLSGNGSSATIKWTLPDSIVKNLSGIYISRAPKHQGPYTDINEQPFAPQQQEAVDPLVTNTSNYYRIRLKQKDGQQITSLPWYLPKEDSIPPAIPAGLQGETNAKGIANIHWQPNIEKDLIGYRLYRSQVRTGEYVEITKGPYTDTTFIDTLNLSFTNPEIYYKIISVDHYYNSSDYSQPVAIRRPDTVAPAPVVIAKLERKDTLVNLSFLPSPSEDVASYALYRCSKEDGKRELVAIYPVSSQEEAFSCSDEPPYANMGKTLAYEIEAGDSAGNKAVTRSGNLFYETGFRKPVQAVQGVADREHKKIRLTWQYESADIDQFVVYRAVNDDGKFMSYAVLPGNVLSFEDVDLHISNNYRYKVKAVFKNGIESRLTKETTVSY